MKRFLIMFVAVFAVFALASCGKKEYQYDGKFIAFETSLNYGAPQITWVEVTIEKGKVTKYFIDELQTTDGVWNSKTKKELKEDYGMKEVSPIQKEWYEQAKVIEDFFLSDGPDKLPLDEKGDVDTDKLAGASMTADLYVRIAKKALENAKKGLYTAFETSLNYGAPQVTWVEVQYKGKKIESYNIDELQTTDGVWNSKTKKELKEDYGMKEVSPIQKEWYEQAKVIEDFFLSDGPDKLPLDEKGDVDTDKLAGASMTADLYVRIANKALSYKK